MMTLQNLLMLLVPEFVLLIQWWPCARPRCFKPKMKTLFACRVNGYVPNNFIKNLTSSESLDFWKYKNIWVSATTLTFIVLFKAIYMEISKGLLKRSPNITDVVGWSIIIGVFSTALQLTHIVRGEGNLVNQKMH